jgi:hypothetical protein
MGKVVMERSHPISFFQFSDGSPCALVFCCADLSEAVVIPREGSKLASRWGGSSLNPFLMFSKRLPSATYPVNGRVQIESHILYQDRERQL